MANTIVLQPTSNSALAAYRPILFRFSADIGAADCPVAFCDIYFGGIFYKSISKTQPYSAPAGFKIFEFDIQDAAQEYLQKYLAANGGSAVIDVSQIMTAAFCRFRTTYMDTNGFINATVFTVPVQATGDTAAVAGTGLQSNPFFCVNAALQQQDNQDLRIHLASFKKNSWSSNVYPLTHRPGCRIGFDQSDFFPILNMSSDQVQCLNLRYRLKNTDSFASTQYCFTTCIPISAGTIAAMPDATQDIAYSFSFTVAGTGPFTISGSPTLPSWMTASVSGNTITLAGTPGSGDVTTDVAIAVTVINGCGSIGFSDTIDVLATGACVPVGFSFRPLPAATVGVPYSASLAITGTAPFSISSIVAPAWMTVAVSGSTVTFTGTPTTPTGDTTITFTLTNCSGADTFDASKTLTILPAPTGLTAVLSMDDDPGVNILDCTISGGVPPYFYSFYATTVGSGACHAFTIASPSGTLSADGTAATGFTWTNYAGAHYQFKCDVTDSTHTVTSNSISFGGCLVLGTLISMNDGSQKKIEDIISGDDLHGSNRVTGISTHAASRVFSINKGLLVASESHVHILSDGRQIQSQGLQTGQHLVDINGRPVKIMHIDIIERDQVVINISTESKTYYANNILTHNKLSC